MFSFAVICYCLFPYDNVKWIGFFETGELMTETINEKTTDALFGFTAAGKVFSCALAFAACLSLNIYSALICCAACLAASVMRKNTVLCPDAFLIVPLVFVATSCGASYLPVTLLAGAALYFLLSIPALKKMDGFFGLSSLPLSCRLGVSMGLAFSVTALLTTYYFGIGATGATVLEMLKNYRYLGFHPNWRGVFYGTITLFAMITYPFKFKKLSQYLPAEVVSLFIPFALNVVLNPNRAETPILEVGSLGFMNGLSGVKDFLPIIKTDFTDSSVLPVVLKGAFSVGVLLFFLSENRKDIVPTSSANGVSALFGGIPAAPQPIKAYGAASAAMGIIAAVTVTLMSVPVSRLPVHSLAVVLIVSAWKKVKFGSFSEMMKREKLLGLLVFLACAASFVFFDIGRALTICIVLSAVTAFNGRRAK